MNGLPSGKFGQYEMQKLINVALFLVSSGILTSLTSIITSHDFGAYSVVVLASWNLILAFISFLAQDNTPKT